MTTSSSDALPPDLEALAEVTADDLPAARAWVKKHAPRRTRNLWEAQPEEPDAPEPEEKREPGA